MAIEQWLNSNYNKIETYVKNLCKSKNVNYQDILSKLNERIVTLQPVIRNEEEFLNGWVIKNTKWLIMDTQKECKRTVSLSNKIDIIDNFNTDYIEAKEILLKPILKSKYKNFYIDRFVHDKSIKELGKKYKLSRRGIDNRIDSIKCILKGEKLVKKEYKGIAQLKEGKIEKVFPDMESVIRNGYERTSISKCLNNKLNSHKGFQWKFVKDLNYGTTAN